MTRFGRCFCPQCGKEQDSSGRLGSAGQCDCGNWIPHKLLDGARIYWIVQIAFCIAIASFFVSFALFYTELPSDPWERFFSPILQVPAFASFIVSFRILIRHKRRHDEDTLLLRVYLFGIVLMSFGFLISILEAILKSS
ncbi:MAG: hypothetical protein ABSB19_11550 [Methylomonas sp.]|jgi:hypothetical protein